MQFKHPEILYVLFALLIPIFIHLFQLQRFVKTPFTNVRFLKHLELQTRKSSKLKKWLVLLTRLMAFTAIILAFAQPYFSKNKLNSTWENSIYIDNSLSMKAKGKQGPLLQRAIQDLVKNIPNKGTYNLLTNDNSYTNLNKESFIEIAKSINYSPVTSSLNTILLRLKQLEYNKKGVLHSQILISDFQKTDSLFTIQDQKINFVNLTAQKNYNISIDSVSIKNDTTENSNLIIKIKNQGNTEKSLVVSAYDSSILLGKSSVKLPENSSVITTLNIATTHKDIVIKIDTDDDCFSFDNVFYISSNKAKKTHILLISNKKNSFLQKIYTDDEFIFTTKNVREIAYNQLHKQNIILINSLETISINLIKELVSFVKKGGSVVVLPSEKTKLESFNNVLNSFGVGKSVRLVNDSLKITKIQYAHPLLRNVFEKRVQNFQYPIVNTYFDVILPKAHPILNFENNKVFIGDAKVGKGKFYFVTASLERNNSNFINSPLVVPVFYNMAKQSLKQSQLSYRLGSHNTITIPIKINKDEVLHIIGKQTDFIPLQEIQTDKVTIRITDKPAKSGFYTVNNKRTILKNIAFNPPKKESDLTYLNIKTLIKDKPNIQVFSSVKDSLQSLSKKQHVYSYFKWFVTLALFFLFIEILLLKYL